jgi:hypothetical protein
MQAAFLITTSLLLCVASAVAVKPAGNIAVILDSAVVKRSTPADSIESAVYGILIRHVRSHLGNRYPIWTELETERSVRRLLTVLDSRFLWAERQETAAGLGEGEVIWLLRREHGAASIDPLSLVQPVSVVGGRTASNGVIEVRLRGADGLAATVRYPSSSG